MIIPHAELQKYHYQAVRDNPEYRLQGLVDVMCEEISFNMPLYSTMPIPELQKDEIAPNYKHILRRLDKLQAEFLYLQNKLNEPRDKKRKDDVPF